MYHASVASPWWSHHETDSPSLTGEPGHNQERLRHQQAHRSYGQVKHERPGVGSPQECGPQAKPSVLSLSSLEIISGGSLA